MDVQVKPRAVLVLVRRPVQEHDFALVPALIRFPDIRQVEGRRTELGVCRHSRHSSLVPFAAVRRIALVPDVDRQLLALWSIFVVGGVAGSMGMARLRDVNK